MSKHIPWNILVEIIGRFPQGASLEQIMVGLDPAVPRRTLQRWLAALVKQGIFLAFGETKARRYQLCQVPEKEVIQSPRNILFNISKEATSIYQNISQPIYFRKPVTYNRKFLEKYKPNTTYYLPESARKKLFAIGSSGDGKYPAGTFAKHVFHRLLIDLSWNSSRLEGNTYSLLETERLIELGKAAEGKDLQETQMILNHKAAIEFLVCSANEIEINHFTILNLHTFLSDNLLPNPAACGRLRTFPIGISHSTYLPIAIPQVIKECFDLLIEKANKIKDPFEQAFFLMVHIPYLQAFDDVNKRTSRLAANIPLIRKNLCPLSFNDVPAHMYVSGLLGIYELNRIELLRDVFVWAYERSCAQFSSTQKKIGEPDPFRMQYRNAIRQIVEEIVRHRMDKSQAVSFIRKQAAHSIQEQDRSRFLETVEKELLSLHEGNIARYSLRLQEYESWKKSWQ